MKQMIVIVQEQDYPELATLLIRNRIHATKFMTEGLYLNRRNITLLICAEDDRVEEVCEVWEYNGHMMVQARKTLRIGGATIFMSNVDEIIKC